MTAINRYYFASISPNGQKKATCALFSGLLAFDCVGETTV